MLDADNMREDEREPLEAAGVADYVLLPGDTIMGKTTLAYRTPMGDAWSTFAATTSIMQGEETQDAYDRLSAIVNDGVISLGQDAVERVTEISNQPPQRITPRH